MTSFHLGEKKISSMPGITHHLCFTYLFACVHESPGMLSPAAKTRSAARIRLVCGASAQSMPPAEPREPSAKVRVTAGLTSAVPSNQVSRAVTFSDRGSENQIFFNPTSLNRHSWIRPFSIPASSWVFSMHSFV